MIKYKTQTRPGLVALYDIWKRKWSGSYNPGVRTGRLGDRKGIWHIKKLDVGMSVVKM